MKKTAPPYTGGTLILSFLQGCGRWFTAGLLLALGLTLSEMLIPQILRFTVDSVIGSEAANLPPAVAAWLDAAGGVQALRQHLWWVAVAVTAVALSSALCRYGTNLCNARGGELLMQHMRDRLFSHIQKLPFSWHMQNQTGDIIQRCTSDTEQIKTFISDQLYSVVRIVIMLVMTLFFMFSMHVGLASVAAVSVPIILGYSLFFHGRIGRHFRECDENEGILSTIAQENLTGVRVVRAFGREQFEQERFDRQNRKYADCWVGLMRLMALFWGTGDLISGLQVLVILCLGSVACVRGTLTAGAFIAFLSYNAMLIWPVRQLGRVISEMSKAGVSLERIRYIMNTQPETDPPDAVTPPMDGDIVFSHVTFGYDPARPVLHDISFTVPGGSTVGILGATGSGKSTLMLLLTGLYPLSRDGGHITVGGTDIARIQKAWLRKNAAIVLQEPFLFSRTLRENIGITREHPEEEELRRAAVIACMDDTISDLTEGYDTMVGERGVTLSGGQKQRTAMARTLVREAPILIFDDSLSAVDAETDAKIRKGLQSRIGNATVFLISHRISTLMEADMILVLEEGRLAEQGTHDELLKKNGIYRRIWEIQQKLPEEEEEEVSR